MVHNGLPIEQLESITPTDVRAYAQAKGWVRVAAAQGSALIFKYPGTDLDQLLVPKSQHLDDYGARITDVVHKLAEIEQRPAASVLADLLNQDADVLRYKVVSRFAENGSLPLGEALNLLDGAKRSILAAACSVVAPQRHHPRLRRSEANQLIRTCRLGQTERGSYTVTIACPLAADSEGTNLPPEQDKPFARRTTEMLTRSLAQIVHFVESDELSTAVEQIDRNPTVSSNLCDALLRMRPSQEGDSLLFSVGWAASSQPVQLPDAIELPYDYFPYVERLYKRLVPPEGAKVDMFVAQIDELRGEVGDDGRRQGEVILTLFHDEEVVRCRTNLDADQYAIADKLHMSAGYAIVVGTLIRGVRISQISNIKKFGEFKEQ